MAHMMSVMQLSDTQAFPHRHFHNICATWTCPVFNVIHNRVGETEKSTVKLVTRVQVAMSNYNLMYILKLIIEVSFFLTHLLAFFLRKLTIQAFFAQ